MTVQLNNAWSCLSHFLLQESCNFPELIIYCTLSYTKPAHLHVMLHDYMPIPRFMMFALCIECVIIMANMSITTCILYVWHATPTSCILYVWHATPTSCILYVWLTTLMHPVCLTHHSHFMSDTPLTHHASCTLDSSLVYDKLSCLHMCESISVHIINYMYGSLWYG